MASLVYNSALEAQANGGIDFDDDIFKVMLVTSSYSPNKKTHSFRSDVTNEVSGGGYVAGGQSAAVVVTLDNTNNRVNIELGEASWPASTITARGAVYYKSHGGSPTIDEVIAYIDFSGNITTLSGTFDLTASTLRLQN